MRLIFLYFLFIIVMLNIIINFEKHNSFEDILNYISHINNINNIDNISININIYIINCNYNYNITSFFLENKITNINAYIYTYKTNYHDSILNDIIMHTKYDYILFTHFNIFLTPEFINWINFNKIKEDCFIRSNIFELKSISNKFFYSYSNDIYYDIINNLYSIINEKGINSIDSNNYIENFNNNSNISIYTSDNIINNSIYYFNNINDFLLVHKNTFKKFGLNNNNNNYKFSFQYITLNFIKNNLSMHVLPFKISSYKLYTNNTYDNIDSFINIKIPFECNFNLTSYINYKVYDILKNQTSTYIRDQIKSYKGYNPTQTITENKYLKNQNIELSNINKLYKEKILKNNNKIDLYFFKKWISIYIKYNLLYKTLERYKKKYVSIIKLLYTNF